MSETPKIHPKIKNFLDELDKFSKSHPSPHHQDINVEDGRKAYLDFSLKHAGWPLKMARTEDIDILSSDNKHKIHIRIYSPEIKKKLPVFIYYHGGGWQRGDVATHDSICRHFANVGKCIVASVKWRLAPENRFPTGINDCFDAYQWVINNGEDYAMDLSRIGIGGDSAGGNMTAAVFQKIHEAHLKMPAFQLLLYPSLDLSCSSWSYEMFAEGYFLTTERVKYYVDGYISSPKDIENPLASPLKQKDLSYLPRTHVVTAGFDPLRGEGEEYVERLKKAGVNVTHKCYEDMIHAFLHMNHTIPEVEDALIEISLIIKEALKD